MLKLNLPIINELRPLVDAFVAKDVDIYLSGFLCNSQLLFVDIGWETADQLQSQLPSAWTLIYAYFVSSEAVANGEADPLLAGTDVASVLANYCPKGMSRADAEVNKQSLIDQANYLLQFPPSRLVYLKGNTIPTAALQSIVDLL